MSFWRSRPQDPFHAWCRWNNSGVLQAGFNIESVTIAGPGLLNVVLKKNIALPRQDVSITPLGPDGMFVRHDRQASTGSVIRIELRNQLNMLTTQAALVKIRRLPKSEI